MPAVTLRPLATAWQWWIAELAAMLPMHVVHRWARTGRPVEIRAFADRTEIERESDGDVELYVETRPLAALDEEAWAQMADLTAGRPTRLLLSPPQIYATTISLPRQAQARLHRAVELQLAEISPADPAIVRWAVGKPRRVDDHIVAPVVLAREATLAAMQGLFLDHDLPLPRIAAATGDGEPIVISQAPARLGRWLHRTWLIAALLLASIPLTILILSALLIWSNQSAIDAVADAAAGNVRQDRLLRQHEVTRTALLPLTRAIAVSQLLDDLADRLPDTVSMTAAESDQGKAVVLHMVAPDPQVVRDALDRDPLYRFIETDEQPRDDGAMQLVYKGTPR